MDEKEKKLSEFLLADFNSIKSEIARRSNLQKAVIVAMLAFYAWMFQKSTTSEITLIFVVIVWVFSFLGYTFYERERSEIKRLGWIIKDKIALPMGNILGYNAEEVIPSEAHAKEPDEPNWRKLVTFTFKIFLYLIFPIYFTGSYLCN